MDEAEFFHRLAGELNCDELNCDELEPGTIVEYTGSLLAAHGLWVVRARVSDGRYTLADIVNEWERLNADRADIKRLEHTQ